MMINTGIILLRMRELHLTYAGLSRICGLSAPMLRNILHNRREADTVTVCRLKDALRLSNEEANAAFFAPLLQFTQQKEQITANRPNDVKKPVIEREGL